MREKEMKTKYYIFALVVLIGISYTTYKFFEKHYVTPAACYKIEYNTPFYPLAYQLIHDEDHLESYAYYYDRWDQSFNPNHSYYKDYFRSLHIDFNKYSVVIVDGAPIKSMYYSWESTFFDDQSEDYCKAYKKGNLCLFINYEKPDSNGYLYVIPRNERLVSAFQGI